MIFGTEINFYVGLHKIIVSNSLIVSITRTFAYFSDFASFRSFRPFFGGFRFIVSPFCSFDAKGMKVTEINTRPFLY